MTGLVETVECVVCHKTHLEMPPLREDGTLNPRDFTYYRDNYRRNYRNWRARTLTETDFKVGDTVVGVGHHDGETGTVTEVRSMYVYARLEAGYTGVFWPSELKLVKPEPKFAVGDWVKVHGRNDKWDGSVCVITWLRHVGFGGSQFYTVEVKQGHYTGPASFFESDLEATEAPAKFQVGDLVTFAEPGNDRWQGGKAAVIGTNGPGKYSTRVRIIEGPPLNDMYRDQKGTEVSFAPEQLEPWVAPEVAQSEAVDGPAHYGGKDNPYEVIKVAEAWGFEKNAYLFNALKYLGRAGKKGSKIEDLKKLVFYVEREIALEEAK